MKADTLTIETKRLKLMPLSIEDAHGLSQLRSEAEVNKFINRAERMSLNEARTFVHKIESQQERGECFYWGIRLQDLDKIVGTICLWNFDENEGRAEVGYELLPECFNKGIMSEALSVIIDFASEELNLSGLCAYTYPENAASVALLKKFGFTVNTKPSIQTSSDMIVYLLHLSDRKRT